MNILFKINGEIVTPELDGSILNGVTRRTVLAVAKEWGYPVSERRISIDEVQAAYKDGTLEEVFGSGTAAVISPVGVLGYKGEDMSAAVDGRNAALAFLQKNGHTINDKEINATIKL